MITFLLFVTGLVLIIKGSGWFVDSAIWIARKYKVSEMIVGATIVSLSTTLPEAVVSVSASLNGNAEMAIGNALGSITCNTGLILGITLIMARPRINDRKKLLAKSIFLIAVLGLLYIISFIFGEVTRLTGMAFLTVLGFYLYSNIRNSIRERKIDEAENDVQEVEGSAAKQIGFFVLGLLMTLAGAELLVDNSEKLAVILRVPDMIIGLTMTALGTSLPELMTAITAIRKKACSLSIGNILGANILNVIMVIGGASTILPINMSPSVLVFHLPFTLYMAGLIVFFAHIGKNHFRRRNGFLLFTSYIVYIIVTFNVFTG